MTILGISAFYHDSAAALICNGEIIAAAQEERFTRKKNDADFPIHAIKFCLDFAEITIDHVDAVVFYDKPFLKFERLLETFISFAPRGLFSFLIIMPVWLRDKFFLKKLIRKRLKELDFSKKANFKLLFTEHHLAHSASAFYASPFNESAILTIDGVGEWATASLGFGNSKGISVIKELHFPHSLGLLYSSFTFYCGFEVNAGEYKLMGLAPYGEHKSVQVNSFIELIKTKLISIKEDGSIYLHQEYFCYSHGFKMVNEKKWLSLFGFPRRQHNDPIETCHSNLALAIQIVTEEIILKMAREVKRLTGMENLCLAGGVALNAVANGRIDEEGIFKRIFIQPAAGDAGGALGAALAAHYIFYQNELKSRDGLTDQMHGSLLGPSYTDSHIKSVAKRYRANYTFYSDQNIMLKIISNALLQGKIVGWFQGRMEFGPRALGARSILADCRDPEMQKRLNLKTKFRESFRPFAPIVQFEHVSDYFDHRSRSPYMLFIKKIKKALQIPYPHNLEDSNIMDKVYFKRSAFPAITHVDYTARIQTVHKETNSLLWDLLEEFRCLTGHPMLVNTSFNVRGEPIVNDPEDAYQCFMETDMDILVMGQYVFLKEDQPQAYHFGKGRKIATD